MAIPPTTTQALIQEIRRRCPKGLAVVTGRPRKDCDTFLQTHNIAALFDACVCMEDGPPKPDPFPVARACELLGVDPKETLMVRGGAFQAFHIQLPTPIPPQLTQPTPFHTNHTDRRHGR